MVNGVGDIEMSVGGETDVGNRHFHIGSDVGMIQANVVNRHLHIGTDIG